MAVLLDQAAAPAIRSWIAQRLPLPCDLAKAITIGIALRGRLIAGFAFTNYNRTNLEISAAADSARWATPANIFTVLAYPFLILGCARVTCLVQRGNRRARRLLEGVGFKCEGNLRSWWGEGKGDALIYGYLKRDFLKSRWYRSADDGEEGTNQRAARCA
jgi:RimJ/RimL family protein N-acetyltransferase